MRVTGFHHVLRPGLPLLRFLQNLLYILYHAIHTKNLPSSHVVLGNENQMYDWLIAAHAAVGDLAFIAFGWVFVELIEPTPTRVTRAKWMALLGSATTWLSWLAGGFYYVNSYPVDKALIKSGPWPWGHLILMEAKEHLFLLGPFIATLLLIIVWWQGRSLIDDVDARKAALILSVVAAVGAITMLLMGAVISLSERVAVVR